MSFSENLKNLSYVSMGRIISAALQGAFYLIFAMILDPEVYGELSYLIALAGMASIISRFGIPNTVVVFTAQGKKLESDHMIIVSLILISISSIILFSINVFSGLLCLVLSMFVLDQHYFLGLKQYRKFMWFSIIKGLLLVSIPILLYFVWDISGILIGMIISHIVSSYSLFRKVHLKIPNFMIIKKNYQKIIHNFGIDVSLNLTRHIDKLVIVPLLGFYSAGIYQLNFQILIILEIIPLSVHSYLLAEESSGQKHTKIYLISIFISAILVLLIVITIPTIIENFLPKYSEGIFGMQVMTLALIPSSISVIFTAKLHMQVGPVFT